MVAIRDGSVINANEIYPVMSGSGCPSHGMP